MPNSENLSIKKENNDNIKLWEDINDSVVNYLYPKEYRNIMDYHYQKIWRTFDFNLLVIVMFILIIYS